MAQRRTIVPGPLEEQTSEGALDLRLFRQVAAAWALTVEEQSRVLRVPVATLYRWLQGSVPTALPADTGERIGHVLAIDLAAQAFYGPGSLLAAGAVRRHGTAPDGIAPALPLCMSSTAALVAVRQAFEHRAGGAHILTVGPLLSPTTVTP